MHIHPQTAFLSQTQPLLQSSLILHPSGYISEINALALAEVALELGAGRKRKDDVLDLSAGVELLVARGSRVEIGQTWAKLHHDGRLHDVSGRLDQKKKRDSNCERSSTTFCFCVACGAGRFAVPEPGHQNHRRGPAGCVAHFGCDPQQHLARGDSFL